jgi:hypothetical protein
MRAASAAPRLKAMKSHRLVVLAAGLGAVYQLALRRPVLTWGATGEEARSRLPGDELLEDADGVSTRAVDIDAPPSAVWPWLAQMGPSPRGGAYTYDWIENLLGLDMHSSDVVLGEFQHPKTGDTIGFGANRMRLERVEPERVLAWRSEDGNWAWTFVLRERDGGTRLISRNRFRLPTLAARVGMLPMEPGSLAMERKMLLGIRRRAESLASSSTPIESRSDGVGRHLLLSSLAAFPGLVSRHELRLSEDRLGRDYRLCDGHCYRVFRETVRPIPDESRTVIEVGFRLRSIDSARMAHWLFQRLCILTTPFWSGFCGFGTKLWMVDPQTCGYAGIYEWGTPASARAYLDVLLPILRVVSVRGSVFSEVHPDTVLEGFLSERSPGGDVEYQQTRQRDLTTKS